MVRRTARAACSARSSKRERTTLPERRGDAVGIGMILTFQFLVGVGVGWLVWG